MQILIAGRVEHDVDTGVDPADVVETVTMVDVDHSAVHHAAPGLVVGQQDVVHQAPPTDTPGLWSPWDAFLLGAAGK